MCGIVAIFSYHKAAPVVDRSELIRIRDRMLLRGPDGAGQWYSKDNRVALGHRRLAIIDLTENASQPMLNHDGSLAIIFNGEIYNYRELRSDLEKKGFLFRSNSDTEVLLHLYHEKGDEMLHDLRGMYTLVIWDGRKQGIFMARDPFGIKPLYYSDNGKTLRVASQVKALLAGGNIDTTPEPAGHVGYFLWGHVPEPYTMYKSIRALPAGSSLWVDASGVTRLKTFCSVSDELAKASINPPSMTREEMQEQLRRSLLDSVRHHLCADVPVGVFLSSGLDSTTLTALAAEAGGNLNTVTLGFHEYRGTRLDETRIAELTAKKFGARHQTVWVTKADFEAERERLMAAMDQPSNDGVNTYFVSLAAARAGMKVAISGLGGDELLGSYPSFKQIPRMVSIFKPFGKMPNLGKIFRFTSAPLFRNFTSPKYAGILEFGGTWSGAYMLRRGMYMPWELTNLLDYNMVREGWRELQTLERLGHTTQNIYDNHLKVSALELNWFMRNQLLRDVDWASMAHSIEVRVPFLDLEFLRSLAPLLCSNCKPKKRDLAFIHRKPLPVEVLNRGKTGFTIPVRDWLLKDNKIAGMRGLRGWAKYVYSEYSQQPIRARPDRDRMKQRSILIYRIGQLGDTLVAMPAIKSIRDRFPLHQLVLLTDKHPARPHYLSSWDVLGSTGWFDDVVFYEPLKRSQGTIKNAFTIAIKMRSMLIEHVFNLAPRRTIGQTMRDRLYFSLYTSNGRYSSYGYEKKPKKNRRGIFPTDIPEWKRLMQIAGMEITDKSRYQFELPVPEEEQRKIDLMLQDKNITGTGDCLIALGPGSKMPAKQWPIERYAELAQRILDAKPATTIVVLGGREDYKVGELMKEHVQNKIHNLAGEITVYGSAAVLKKCKLYIGNDTGTMHLSAMVGTRCIALFSARDYAGKWEPLGDGHIILRHDIDCAGCMLEVCANNNKCLRQISVDEVFNEVRALII